MNINMVNPKVKLRMEAAKEAKAKSKSFASMKKKKVLVVGGGLAGLHFAKCMADCGCAENITVVEKYQKGKVKLCAEGLINYARELNIVPDEFLEIPFCDVTLRVGGAMTHLSGDVPLITTFDKAGFAEYESDLVRDAGGTIIRSCRVVDLKGDRASISSSSSSSSEEKNEEEIKYNILVGADGAHSVVRKRLEGWGFVDPDKMDRRAIAIQGDAGPYSELEWGIDIDKFRGLWWVFPHKKYTAVGIGLLKSDHGMFDKSAFLKYFGDRGIHIAKESVKGHPIVCSSCPQMATGLRDVYLIGEAGGFTKGSSGEGFSGAMISASRLAKRLLSPGDGRKVEHADLFPALVRHVKLSYKERQIGLAAYKAIGSPRMFPFNNVKRNLWLSNFLAASVIDTARNELVRRLVITKKFKAL